MSTTMSNQPTKPCPGCGLHYNHRDNCSVTPKPPLPSTTSWNDPTYAAGPPDYRPALILLALLTAAFVVADAGVMPILSGAAFLYYLAKSNG